MNFQLGVLLLLVAICSSQSDSSKWVWGRPDGTRTFTADRRYNGDSSIFSKPLFQANVNGDRVIPSRNKFRYEVTESTYPLDYTTYRPRPIETYRPDSSINRPTSGSFRPPTDYVRPTNSIDNYNPNRPYENEYRPLGNGFRPPNGEYSLHGLRPGVGTNGRPILTGPTPSWEQDGNDKYKDYNVCKCVHSFNCNSPGIKFGSCDTDKQYCCYKSKQNEGYGNTGKPITNFYERPRPRPVLAGPGGPVDGSGRPPYQKIPQPVRPYRPEDRDRELNEAYKKGLASAVYQTFQRPYPTLDRDPNGFREQEYYRPVEGSFKPSHPSKYGLYEPNNYYGRAANSSIAAITDDRN